MSANGLQAAVWFGLAFVLGALPLSVWIGRLGLHVNIRAYGDGNPGATNVFRAGGWRWGLLAALSDLTKAALPVGLALAWGGINDWGLVFVALAPILGHAFSPLLGGRGGKALAATFGVWSGLTLWEGPTVLGLALGFWIAIFSVEGWAVLLGMLSLFVYGWCFHPDPWLLPIWVGNTLILAWKHRSDLSQRPSIRGWWRRVAD